MHEWFKVTIDDDDGTFLDQLLEQLLLLLLGEALFIVCLLPQVVEPTRVLERCRVLLLLLLLFALLCL
jgi:hypothetical protein